VPIGATGEPLGMDVDMRDGFCAFQQWRAAVADHQILLTSDTSALQRQGVDEEDPPALDDDEDDDDYYCTKGPSRKSIVDCLLVELYDAYGGGGGRRADADSLDSSTEASSSDAVPGRSNTGSSFLQELQERRTRRHQMNYLAQKGQKKSCVCVCVCVYLQQCCIRKKVHSSL